MCGPILASSSAGGGLPRGPPPWSTTTCVSEGASHTLTGPDGEKSAGYWEVLVADAPNVLEVRDGFADDSGTANDDMPTMVMRTTFEAISDTRTRMTTVTQFPSIEAMEQLVNMGMEEGMREAMSQIEAVLAA